MLINGLDRFRIPEEITFSRFNPNVFKLSSSRCADVLPPHLATPFGELTAAWIQA